MTHKSLFRGIVATVLLLLLAAVDDSFEAFQEAVLALETDLHGETVSLDTLRGDTLSFGWRGRLRVE